MGNGPFGPEIFQMLAGLGGPQEPGIHGVIEIEKPKPEALEFITSLRDQCDEFIRCYDKECPEGKEESDELQGDSKERKSKRQEKDGEESSEEKFGRM